MVAGMVMPLADLRSIYELLFRDGVMVTKKDKRPQCIHPELQGIANLKVIRAMGSLKSKGFVRETFAWKHAYFYLTNEGIVYLREYLRLPPEIVPSSLQRVRRPASTLDVMRRAARVQTVEGPTSYVPKPRAGGETQEGMMDRQGYRHMRGGEEEGQPERPPMRFRGTYQSRAPPGEPGVQTQTFFRRGQGQGLRRGEERVAEEGPRRGFRNNYAPPENRAVRSPVPVREAKPPTPVPVAAPVVAEIPKEVPVALAVVQQVVEPDLPPAFIPAVEPEAPPSSPPAQEVVVKVVEEVEEEEAEVEEEEEEEAEVVEEVAAEPPAATEEPEPVVEAVVEEEEAVVEEEEAVVEEKETIVEEESDVEEEEESDVEEEEEAAVEEEEAIVEEPAVEVITEAPQPVLEEPVEAVEEEVIEATPAEHVEEEPKPASVVEESSEEEEDEDDDDDEDDDEEEEEAVVEEDTPAEVVVEEVPHDEIEVLEEPKELVDSEVEASIPVTKAMTPEPDFDLDMPTPPPSVAEDFTDLTEEVEHVTVTHKIDGPTTYMTSQEVVTVVEQASETQVNSQSHTVIETSVQMVPDMVSEFGLEQEKVAAFEADFATPVVPSDCPIAALKSSLPQGDWGFLTEDPEEEQEVKKVWPDSLEG